MELHCLCMRTQDVATQETRNKKKTAITCFTAAALISFATNRVVAPVYSNVPSVGRQASENSGSGIASRVCVGSSSAARRVGQKKEFKQLTCAALAWTWPFATVRCAASSVGLFSPPVMYNERCGMCCIAAICAVQAMVSVRKLCHAKTMVNAKSCNGCVKPHATCTLHCGLSLVTRN